MPDQLYPYIAQDVSNLQQQLTPAAIARLLSGSAQSAVSGIAGMPGDLSNMFAGRVGNQPTQSAFPTYSGLQQTLPNYTGLPPASDLPTSAPEMPGLNLMRLAMMAPLVFGHMMQNQNNQPPGQPADSQPPASGPSWISRLLSGQLGGLTGNTPAY
jgi:hypothetical protein